jgi:MFS family permease
VLCNSVGGSIPVVWSYFAEFLPVAARGTMMVFMAMFWMIGSLIIAGMVMLHYHYVKLCGIECDNNDYQPIGVDYHSIIIFI